MSQLARAFLLPMAALVAVLSALPADASYVIYTKDGGRIEAREKPTIVGKRAVYLTPLGTSHTLAVEDWDQARSEKANREGFGGAYVLDDPSGKTGQVLPNPEASKPSLSEYIKKHGRQPDPDRPEPRVGELVTERQTRPPRAADRAIEAAPVVLDPVVSDAFMRALDGSNVKGVKLGNLPSALRVAAVTDTEQQVFLALMASARGLKEARAAGKPLEKVEVVLATGNGESAARFDITPDDADALLNGRITPAKYFVTRVIF